MEDVPYVAPAPRRRGSPVQVWVSMDEHGRSIVSFEPLPSARAISVPMPEDIERLLQLHSSVATTMRAVADADNNRDAVRILRDRVQAERRKRLDGQVPTVREVRSESVRWRQEPVRDLQREYPTETTESVSARPIGQPDSNRRRH